MHERLLVSVAASLLAGASLAAIATPAAAQVAGPLGPTPQSGAPVVSASGANAPNDQPTPASGDQTSEGAISGLQDIIVTAEKRGTNLQRTPIAVTALSGAALAQAQVRTLQDIQTLVPSVKIGSAEGYAQITVRGIGVSNFTPGAESAVAVNLNGVYISREIAQLSGLYDVSSLEVLRGPQGTLYGRNATAGSVNITTTLPDFEKYSGYGRLTIGNYGDVRAEAAVGGPVIADKLAIRLAGFVERRDGYGTNVVTGHDIDDQHNYGLRATVVAKPTDHLKATLTAEYFYENDRNGTNHFFGGAGLIGLPGALGTPPLFQVLGGFAPREDSFNVASRDDPRFHLRTVALTGDLEWSSGAFGLRSITGYRNQHALTFSPIGGGSPQGGYYVAGEPDDQFSEELQAHYDGTRLHLTVGGYYFHEVDSASPSLASLTSTVIGAGFGVPVPATPYDVDFVEIGGTIRTNAKAVFAQGTYQLTDRLSLTAGVRYSHETKGFDQNYSFSLFTPVVGYGTIPASVRQPSRTFTATDPKVGIQYQLSPGTLLYASYSKGFKSGSFDIGFFPSLGFRPERLTDYEGGIKATLLDRRLRLNLAGFYYDYTDLQVPELVGFAVTTANAGTARDYGVEAEATFAPVPAFELDASATYLHARYTAYTGPDPARPLLPAIDYTGNRLNNAPDFTGHLSGQYSWTMPRGSLVLKLEADYTTKFFFSAANLPLLGQNAFAKGNAFLTYRSDRNWYLTAFVRNVTDKITRIAANVEAPQLGNPVVGALAPPRTFGAEIGYKF